jgi:hypothetical protein
VSPTPAGKLSLVAALCVAASCVAVLGVAATARADPPLLFYDTAAGYIPFANDVPIMTGAGVRFADRHEIWARGGIFALGDDIRHGFGVGGYRAVFRRGRFFRPILGGLFAGLPDTCTHDRFDRPKCKPPPLFVFAALGGFRLEPARWFGIDLLLSLGTDTHPNPFGMAELGVTVSQPP